MSFLKRAEDWLMNPKRKLDRLKGCVWALEVGTILCCFLDKIFTYLAITYLGAVELNPVPRMLTSYIGLIPTVILGFLANLLPLILMHIGIRKFKWNQLGHYWIYALFISVYFVLFFKLVQSQIPFFF